MKKEVIEIGHIAAKTAKTMAIKAKLPLLGYVLTSFWSVIEAL